MATSHTSTGTPAAAPAEPEVDEAPATLAEAIAENAAGPQSASADGVQVRQHSLTDQIEADKHLARKTAALNPAACLHMVKIVPPGAD